MLSRSALIIGTTLLCFPHPGARLFAENSFGSEIPPGKNRELVLALCSSCHSLQLVGQNRMTRSAWDRTLQWMETKHKLRFYSPLLREQILDYLGEYLTPGPLLSDPLNGLPPLELNPLPARQ